ncbi:MAG: hypothetical protein WBP61_06625, partial [Nocardioides sp.]
MAAAPAPISALTATPTPGLAAPTPAQTGAANPFAGFWVRDILLDAGALLTLFVALALPWNLSGGSVEDASDHWWVVLSILIACLGLVPPYLGAFRVPGITPASSLLAKALCTAPLVLSLVLAFLFELINLTNPLEGGIGTGVVAACFGFALVVVPRRFDDLPTLHRAGAMLTTALYLGAAAVLAISFGGELVRFLVNDAFGRGLPTWYVLAQIVVASLIFLVPRLTLAAGGAWSPKTWTPIAVAYVVAYLVVALAAGEPDVAFTSIETYDPPAFGSMTVEKFTHDFGWWSGTVPSAAGTFVLALAAGFALGPWNRISGPQSADPETAQAQARAQSAAWVRVAVTAALFGAALMALSAVLNIGAASLGGISQHFDIDVNGAWVAVMVLFLVAAGLAAVAALTASRSRSSLRLPASVSVGWFLVGIVTSVVGTSAMIYFGRSPTALVNSEHEVFLLLVLPVLVLGALTLPRGVRRVHGPLLPAHLFADQGTA